MSGYDSGYDPMYGYNRNAFAHKTMGTAVMGQVVKMIVTPLGLVSEAVHARKEKRRPSSNAAPQEAGSRSSTAEGGSGKEDAISTEERAQIEDSAYVDVPPEVAEELITSGQAESTSRKTPTHELVPQDKEEDGVDRDEADWALDEAAADGEDNELASRDEKDNVRIEERIANKAGDLATNSPLSKRSKQKLPFPVIVPQRRPGTKTRGFVRAYPPVLEEVGISQDAFLGFLKDLHTAAQASPVFDVIMIATAIAGGYPDPIIGLAVQAVQIAAGIGQEIQERYRTNKFLTQANKDFFIPKGLYAMIVTYKTGGSEQPDVGIERVDLGAAAVAKYGGGVQQDETVAEPGSPEMPKMLDDVKEKMKQLRIASGETHGEAEMPVTCAPLIFPALDAAAASSPAAKDERNGDGIGQSIKAKSKSASKFVNDYNDRRAQASYAYQNPDSTLTAQVAPVAPRFRSRFADPNNATNTHFFTLITGGKFKAEPLGARRRYERAQRKAAEKRAQGIREKPSKRMLQENVLYLMVVNMPTEEELAKAKKEIQEAKEKKAAEKKQKLVKRQS